MPVNSPGEIKTGKRIARSSRGKSPQKMPPEINSRISGQRNLEKQIERQMGCMTGFLHLFDRHQILAGKRFYSAKQLSTFPTSDSLPPSPSSPSSGGFPSSPEKNIPARSLPPFPLPVFEVKDGVKTSWKLREAPRLSLDSRAIFDAKGKLRPREIRTTTAVFSGDPSDGSDSGYDHDKHRRSPSVVARLMGLDALPFNPNEEPQKRSELRRSASESRVSRDLGHFNSQKLSPKSSDELFRPRKADCSEAQESFPELKSAGSMYEAIEKKLRMRDIEEPAKDLETLKQILEALHLKGLLQHRSASSRRTSSPENTPSTKSIREPLRKSFTRSPEPKKPSRSSISSSVRRSPKTPGSDQATIRSPRIRRPKQENITLQRANVEECRNGNGLLERCDKLMHSIAAITSPAEQVSPVSVLDSSFQSENNSLPPLPKRSIDFKDQIANWEEDHQRNQKATPSEISISPEKKIRAGQCDDYALVADAKLTSDLQFLRHHISSENLIQLTEKFIKQDMTTSHSGELDWTSSAVETSAAVLHIERQLFKDLVVDTIRELTDLPTATKTRPASLPRRKLRF